jgi:hypothetical protein
MRSRSGARPSLRRSRCPHCSPDVSKRRAGDAGGGRGTAHAVNRVERFRVRLRAARSLSYSDQRSRLGAEDVSSFYGMSEET